jgi:hypothetical protein
MMTNRLPCGLLIMATLLGGLLAGGNVDRAIVQNSAWHELGAVAWGTYSRHADLSNRGFVLYPFLGIGGALLSLAATASFRRNGGVPRAAALPIYAGALLTVGGLLATTQAVPIMLSVAHLGDDQEGLRQALQGFEFWGNIRGVLQVLAFLANLWSLAAAVSPMPGKGAPRVVITADSLAYCQANTYGRKVVPVRCTNRCRRSDRVCPIMARTRPSSPSSFLSFKANCRHR